MVPTVQTAPIGSTRSTGLRMALGALVVLAVCEVIVLQLYVGAIRRVTELTVDLEYARGAAVIASAQANRCDSLGLK
jgi:hypothetical protein